VSRGLVLGKFMPPHAGHVYLIEAARRLCDDLTIVVGTLPTEPIPGPLRAGWMRALFPAQRVVHLDEVLPQAPSEHPDFWAIWRVALVRALGAPPDLVFTSDRYGAELAATLGARWIPIDPDRTARPISATAIRAAPLAHWELLPRPVRPYYLKRLSVFGPESTGKTTLAQALADRLGTLWAPEYARVHLEARPDPAALPTAADLDAIARGQAACEDALALDATRLLVCDTDPLLTVVWAETLHGAASPAVRDVAAARRYDLTLLLDVDLPWVADPVRYRPDDRRGFLDRCAAALEAAGRRVVRIDGDGASRLDAAERAARELIA
jgi:NadR type nicotinamide-nucleotide adenylyltransferase